MPKTTILSLKTTMDATETGAQAVRKISDQLAADPELCERLKKATGDNLIDMHLNAAINQLLGYQKFLKHTIDTTEVEWPFKD